MSIAQLREFLLLDFVCFAVNSVLIPDELQIEVEKDDYLIQQEVYAHFLSFLIYFHLKNTSQYRISLRDLQMTIQEFRFIENSSWKAFSYNTLGIGFHLLQDTIIKNLYAIDRIMSRYRFKQCVPKIGIDNLNVMTILFTMI